MRPKFTLSRIRFIQRLLSLIAASTLPDLCFYGMNKKSLPLARPFL